MILVIGATRGTGLLVAQRLTQNGAVVRALARDPPRAKMALASTVEVVAGDVTKVDTLPAALRGVSDIVYTAGVRSGRLASDETVRLTDYQGVLNALAAARAVHFNGRFVYMTSIGVATPSVWGSLLNFVKGNTLAWRRLAEDEIRRSGFDYTIVRAGFLVNRPDSRGAIEVSQRALPLAPRHRIDRSAVADVIVAALSHARTSRVTFEVVWGRGPRRDWDALFSRLLPDA